MDAYTGRGTGEDMDYDIDRRTIFGSVHHGYYRSPFEDPAPSKSLGADISNKDPWVKPSRPWRERPDIPVLSSSSDEEDTHLENKEKSSGNVQGEESEDDSVKVPVDKGKTRDFKGSDLVADMNDEDITPEMQQTVLDAFKGAMRYDKFKGPIMSYMSEEIPGIKQGPAETDKVENPAEKELDDISSSGKSKRKRSPKRKERRKRKLSKERRAKEKKKYANLSDDERAARRISSSHGRKGR
ncbi:hypothetical protein MPER_12218, partial [Moniliophthora perniciosa FA553]